MAQPHEAKRAGAVEEAATGSRLDPLFNEGAPVAGRALLHIQHIKEAKARVRAHARPLCTRAPLLRTCAPRAMPARKSWAAHTCAAQRWTQKDPRCAGRVAPKRHLTARSTHTAPIRAHASTCRSLVSWRRTGHRYLQLPTTQLSRTHSCDPCTYRPRSRARACRRSAGRCTSSRSACRSPSGSKRFNLFRCVAAPRFQCRRILYVPACPATARRGGMPGACGAALAISNAAIPAERSQHSGPRTCLALPEPPSGALQLTPSSARGWHVWAVITAGPAALVATTALVALDVTCARVAAERRSWCAPALARLALRAPCAGKQLCLACITGSSRAPQHTNGRPQRVQDGGAEAHPLPARSAARDPGRRRSAHRLVARTCPRHHLHIPGREPPPLGPRRTICLGCHGAHPPVLRRAHPMTLPHWPAGIFPDVGKHAASRPHA